MDGEHLVYVHIQGAGNVDSDDTSLNFVKTLFIILFTLIILTECKRIKLFV